MILQRDGRFRPEIQKNGCYLCCLLYYANKFTNCSLMPENVNAGMWVLFLRRGWINEKCRILKPDEILNFFGVDCVYTDTHEPPDRECKDDEFEILYFRHPEVGGHFVCGDGHGRVTYDPWGVSKAASDGTLLSKRIFRRKS